MKTTLLSVALPSFSFAFVDDEQKLHQMAGQYCLPPLLTHSLGD